jgi:DNA-3-methyladenine glycosylase I
MEKRRCSWAERNDLFRSYHDLEWGNPVYDDRTLFEFLILETFQAGLSWQSILSKREGFRMAFDHFDFHKIASYNDHKIMELIHNPAIVRNGLKIKSTIANAKAFMGVQNELATFSSYVWGFVNNKPIDKYSKISDQWMDANAVAHDLSKDLKKRGFKFVGPTVVYAFMQAIGMVNDHSEDCWKRY